MMLHHLYIVLPFLWIHRTSLKTMQIILTSCCNGRILKKLTIFIYVGAKQEDLGPKIIKCNVLLNREDKVDEIFLSKSNNKRRSH